MNLIIIINVIIVIKCVLPFLFDPCRYEENRASERAE